MTNETSDTEVISLGSLHDYDIQTKDNEPIATTPRCRRHKLASSSSPMLQKVTDEVQDEIEELLDDVPQIANVFTIINKIGSGTFSSVYVAKLKDHPKVKQLFALKHIIPTSHPSRIENELRCLHDIGGFDNVIGVKACFRERDHIVIVMPYFPHDKFQDYVQNLSLRDVQNYMKHLLVSLQRVHDVNIIHRDVKPSNFLYNKHKNQYALVDFGLAQKVPLTPNEEKTAAVKKATVTSSVSKSEESDNKSSISSPRKRKVEEEAESTAPQSPRKLRGVGGDAVEIKIESRLAEIDINTSHNLKAKCDPKTLKTTEPDTVTGNAKENLTQDIKAHSDTLVPPAAALFNPASGKSVKSPRRMLLTKRALDSQRKTLFSPPNQMGKDKGTRKTVVVEKGGKSMYKSMAPINCQCFGKPVVCNICLARSGQHAPRAGTPGFRAPEVLMKCPQQTTAVDIWSAGVIFLSLLSGRYPFFKAPDDMTALAQIIAIFGSEETKASALAIGKNLLVNPKQPALDVSTMCHRLRKGGSAKASSKVKVKGSSNSQSSFSKDIAWKNIPDSAFDLLKKLMDLNPLTRISATEALKHPFLNEK